MRCDSCMTSLFCRSLFATHYHQLSDEYKDNPDVALKHMACHIQPQEDGPEQAKPFPPLRELCRLR